MSVSTVSLLPGLTATATSDYRVTYQTKYQVITTSATDGPLVVMNGATLPQIWDSYNVSGGIDINAFAKRMTATQDTTARTKWEVTIDWEPLTPGEQSDNRNSNPFNRPTRYWMESVNYTEIIEKDQAGNNIVNKANRPFDEPLTQEVSRIVLMAEKPYATLQQIVNLNITYAMAVNTDTFYGAAARTCLCRPILCSQLIQENDFQYYMATFGIEFNEDTWDRKIVNRGFGYIDAGGVYRDEIHGKKINEPVLLDDNGHLLGAGAVGTPITFRVRREVAFSGLGI